MLFTFKRDNEGRERIYVGDVCVAQVWRKGNHDIVDSSMPAVQIRDAIERADEAGFWAQEAAEWNVLKRAFKDGQWKNNEVTIDVPIADSTILTVENEGDES